MLQFVETTKRVFQKGGWDIWRMADPLNNMLPRLPEKTKWVESCDDTTAPFFLRAAPGDTAAPHVKKEPAAPHRDRAVNAPGPKNRTRKQSTISERDTAHVQPGRTPLLSSARALLRQPRPPPRRRSRPSVTFTPSAITTIWEATLNGTIEQPSNATPGVFGVYVATTTGTDNFIVKRGSYCSLF